MSTQPPPPEDRTLTDDEREAERRFQATLGRLVNTPHKPHADAKLGRNKAGAKTEKRR